MIDREHKLPIKRQAEVLSISVARRTARRVRSLKETFR
jgi:hypothetical protein